MTAIDDKRNKLSFPGNPVTARRHERHMSRRL
jgi:hypothetical protein